MIESGALRFTIAGEERVLRAGEVVVIPPDAPHMVEALEDSLAVDVFRRGGKTGFAATMRI